MSPRGDLDFQLNEFIRSRVQETLEVDSKEQPLVRKPRVVKFQKEVEIFQSPAEYMTQEEMDAAWYSIKELADIEKEDAKLLRVARQFGIDSSSSSKFCLRGLEINFSRRSRLETRSRKITLISTVLLEQQNQFLRGENDPARIRRKSVAASKPARQFAMQLARQDELAARAIQRAKAPRYHRSKSCFDRRVCMEKIQIDHSLRKIVL